jgi:penicillin-binding protein 1A
VIVPPDIVGMMNAMLTRVVTSGTGRRAALPGWQVAGKSGTTQDFKDAWFVGYTANLTTGVWLGNDNGKPMRQVTGGSLPADAWKTFMVAAHEGLPATPLPGNYKIGDPANTPVASGYGGQIVGYDASGNPVYENTELPAGGSDPYGQPLPGLPAQEPGALPPQDGIASVVPGQDDRPAVREAAPPRGEPGYASREEPPMRRIYRDAPDARDPAPVDRGQPDRYDPYAQDDPYGDDAYGGPPPEYGYGEPARMRPPADLGPPRVVRRGDLPADAVLEGRAIPVRPEDLPPDAVLEGPAPGGRESDRSLFRGLFGN